MPNYMFFCTIYTYIPNCMFPCNGLYLPVYQTMHILTHCTRVNRTPHPVSTANQTEDYSCYGPQTVEMSGLCDNVVERDSRCSVLVCSVGWFATDVSAQRTCLLVMDPIWCPDISAIHHLKLCNKIFRHLFERG